MAAALFIVNVLADDFPILFSEGFLAEDLVGVGEAVEDESGPSATSRTPEHLP